MLLAAGLSVARLVHATFTPAAARILGAYLAHAEMVYRQRQQRRARRRAGRAGST
jgi:hypothetical protein